MSTFSVVAWLLLAGAVIAVDLWGGRRLRSSEGVGAVTDQLMIVATVVGLAGPPVTLLVAEASSSLAWAVLGAVVGGAGLALRAWSMRTLGRHFTLTPHVDADHALVTSGPYRLVRHPGYTGLVASILGMQLVLGVPWLTIFLVPILVLLPLRILVEEDQLSAV